MPTVSGATLAFLLSKSSQALACTAGNTAFCAASPYSGANSAPRLCAYFFSASLLAMVVAQALFERLDHLVGHALRNEDAEVVGRRGEPGDDGGQRRDRAEALELQRLVAHRRQRAQALAADHVGLLDGELRRHVGLAGNGGQHRRVAAVVRDVAVLDAGGLGDRFHRVVAGGRDARGRDPDLARLGLHRVEQLLRVLVRRVRVDADHLDVGDVEEEVPVVDARGRAGPASRRRRGPARRRPSRCSRPSARPARSWCRSSRRRPAG